MLMIHVGFEHRGSRYVDESLSRSRGRVGLGGIGMLFVMKMLFKYSGVDWSSILGRAMPRIWLRAGMKSICVNGPPKTSCRDPDFAWDVYQVGAVLLDPGRSS